MKRLALLLLLPRLALADVDGGFRWDDALYDACPSADAPTVLDGGAVVLSPERVRRLDCALVSCDVRRRELEETPPTVSTPAAVVAALGVGLLLGLAGGAYATYSLMRR